MTPEPLAARLDAEVERLTAALAGAAQRVRAGDDPEAIHDLRVATRRLGEALATWRVLLEGVPAREARRRLRRLRRRLGPVRDEEVRHADLVARLAGAEASLRRALEPVVRRLGRRVERGRRDAARHAAAKRIEAIGSRVAAALRPRAARAAARPDPVPAAVARARRRHEHAGRAIRLAAGNAGTDARLHAARIALKKDRYASEALAAVAPEGAPELAGPGRLAALRRAQTALGTVHDRAALGAWLGRGARARTLATLRARIAREHRAAVRDARRALAALAAAPARPPARGSRARGARAGGPGGASAGAPPRPRAARPRGRPRGS